MYIYIHIFFFFSSYVWKHERYPNLISHQPGLITFNFRYICRIHFFSLTYIHTYIYTHIYIYKWIYTCTYTYIYIYIHISIYIYIYIYTHMHIYIHMYICVFIKKIYIYIHPHIYMHIYILLVLLGWFVRWEVVQPPFCRVLLQDLFKTVPSILV